MLGRKRNVDDAKVFRLRQLRPRPRRFQDTVYGFGRSCRAVKVYLIVRFFVRSQNWLNSQLRAESP